MSHCMGGLTLVLFNEFVIMCSGINAGRTMASAATLWNWDHSPCMHLRVHQYVSIWKKKGFKETNIAVFPIFGAWH